MTSRGLLPFFLLRPVLLVRDLRVDRDHPDLAALDRIEDGERFLWAILPHAARTFSASILMLPRAMALPAAVGYLYCRTLDTFEDLLPDPPARDAALAAFTARLDDAEARAEAGAETAPLAPAPKVDPACAVDPRDAAHVLLANRIDRVDQVYLGLAPELRAIVRDLVRDMAEGMRWATSTFADQHGVLTDGAQLSRYCQAVLGNPIVFCARLHRQLALGQPDLPEALRRDALDSGEFIQLANITRDIEKDLVSGKAYHPRLAAALGRATAGDTELTERVREVRTGLLDRARSLACAYPRFVDGLALRSPSLTRASAMLLWLFTVRHYEKCARTVGRPAPSSSPGGLSILLGSLPASISAGSALRHLRRGLSRLGSLGA